MRDVGVVLAAAGSGSRFGGKKQLLRLQHRPLIHYSLDVFCSLAEISAIAVVLPREDLEVGHRLIEEYRGRCASGSSEAPGVPAEACRYSASGAATVEIRVIEGGARRQDSVVNGLRCLLEGGVRYVLVHDAARPLLRSGEVARVLGAVREVGAALLGTPVTDSVKRVEGGRIVRSIPREEVWTVQTPQASVLETLLEAYQRNRDRELTDEASALELVGVPVAVVEGSRDNLKITRPSDLARAEWILRRRSEGAPADEGPRDEKSP